MKKVEAIIRHFKWKTSKSVLRAGHPRHDRDRGPRFRPAERAHGNVPRHANTRSTSCPRSRSKSWCPKRTSRAWSTPSSARPRPGQVGDGKIFVAELTRDRSHPHRRVQRGRAVEPPLQDPVNRRRSGVGWDKLSAVRAHRLVGRRPPRRPGPTLRLSRQLPLNSRTTPPVVKPLAPGDSDQAVSLLLAQAVLEGRATRLPIILADLGCGELAPGNLLGAIEGSSLSAPFCQSRAGRAGVAGLPGTLDREPAETAQLLLQAAVQRLAAEGARVRCVFVVDESSERRGFAGPGLATCPSFSRW